MKKWYWIGFLIVLLLWSISGWLFLLPRMEDRLTNASKQLLEDTRNHGAFSDVQVKFSGQEATLTGPVASLADREAAGRLVAEKVRIPDSLGSGLNPVIAVNNAITVPPEYSTLHPKPWLVALVMPGSAVLSGVLPTSADREAAVKALSPKLTVGGLSLTNQIKTAPELANIRSAIDLPGTLVSGDIDAINNAAKADEKLHAALAVSACDGHWTLLPASSDNASIAAALGLAQPDPLLIASAYAPLENLKVDLMEKERIAHLPAPAIGIAILGNTIQVTGMVADAAAKSELMKALNAKYPGLVVQDNTTISGAVKPGGDWAKALADAPKPGAAPAIFALGLADAKPTVWDGKAVAADFAKSLAATGAASVPVQALFDAVDAFNKKQAAEAAALAKAKSEAEAKAKADAEAKAKADMAAKQAAADNAKAAAAPAVNPNAKAPAAGYLGYAIAGGTVRLFGVLGSDQQKADALKEAAAAFPGLKIISDGLSVQAGRAMTSVALPKGIDTKVPSIGILGGAGGAPSSFKFDAFDSEIVKAMPKSGLSEDDLAKALQDFRVDLLKGGKLKQDAPYLSMSSDGKTVAVAGEVADAAARQKILDALKTAAAGLSVNDNLLVVSPLVTAGGNLDVTLKSLPKFEPGKAQILTAQPGFAARPGVVHGIYFATGSDRSKDQERATFQIRRILASNPAAKFEIVGHTDNVGNADSNTKLSQSRAEKFTAYLEAAGIPKAQLTTRGAGPKEPIADNATEAGRALNRRVDVMLK